jgi:hypothetical protein
MALLIDRHRPALDRTAGAAAAIRTRLDILFPILDGLCEPTCPECRAPCCRHATVAFDHPDLIFLHLAGQAVPPLQPRTAPGGACNYLGPRGCLLPRAGRPWICTWYLCPSQKSLLQEEPAKIVSQTISEIKGLRKEMETAFIRTVAGGRSREPERI